MVPRFASVPSPVFATVTFAFVGFVVVPPGIAATRFEIGMSGMPGAVFDLEDAAQWKEMTGISDAFVQQAFRMVRPGQSAVLALVRASDPARVAEEFRGVGGRVIRTTPSKDAAAKFKESINPIMSPAL